MKRTFVLKKFLLNFAVLIIFGTVDLFAAVVENVGNYNFCVKQADAAARRKSTSKRSQKKVKFDVNKFIQAHRKNDANGVMEQLVAANSNWRRTFTLDGVSGVNLLMIACQFATETGAMNSIYTLIENCPDLINARDSLGQTAIYYCLVNTFTIPFQTLMNDKRTQINIVNKAGVSPLQLFCLLWGSKYEYAEEAIWEMLRRGADLNETHGEWDPAIGILMKNNDRYLVDIFFPVAKKQYELRRSR